MQEQPTLSPQPQQPALPRIEFKELTQPFWAIAPFNFSNQLSR
jgi:hypothetical protein